MNHEDTGEGGAWVRPIWGIGWLVGALFLLGGRWGGEGFRTQGDVPLHYHLTRVMGVAFDEGRIWVEWAGLLDGGRGDRFFTFYPRLFYWIAALPEWLLGLSSWRSLWVAMLWIILFNQWSAYRLARRFFGRWESGWVGLGYVIFPGWAMIGLNRGFLPQSLGMGFLPLVILGLVDLLGKERRGRGLGWLTVGLCGTLMTHILSAYLACLIIGGIGLATLVPWVVDRWRGKGESLEGTGLPRLVTGIAWSVCLTAIIWLPLLVGLGEVQIDLQVARQEYQHYLLFAKPADGTAYRLAWAGFNDVASLVILGQSALVGLLWAGIRRQGRPFDWLVDRLLLLMLGGLALAIPALVILWRIVPGLPYLQFPWRWQPITALCAALLLVGVWRERAWLSGWRGRVLIPLAGLLLLCLGSLTVMLVWPWPGPKEDRFGGEEQWRLAWIEGRQSVPSRTFKEGLDLQDRGEAAFLGYTANQVYFRPRGAETVLHGVVDRPGGLEVVSGEGTIETLSLGLESRQFRLSNRTAVEVRLLTYADPHWKAQLDGVALAIRTEAGSGLMILQIPAGNHRLSIDYRPSRIPWWISFWTANAGVAVLGVRFWRRRLGRRRLD
jgi:hypothetical protein